MHGLKSRLDTAEDKFDESEDRSEAITKTEHRKKRDKKFEGNIKRH